MVAHPSPDGNFSAGSIEALTSRAIDPAASLSSGLVAPVASRADLPAEFSAGQFAGTGMTLAYRDLDGNTITHQYRPDVPKLDADGDPMKYPFPKGAPYGFGWVQAPASAKAPVLVAEGLLKALAASQALGGAHAVVAVPGCRMRKDGTDYGWAAERSIVIALDADLATNRDVWDGALAMREGFLAAGAEDVRFLVVPGDGKDGLDDALARLDAADRRTALLSWIDAAGPLCPAPLPKGVRIIPDPEHPYLVARELRADHQDADGNATLVNRDGLFHQYDGCAWHERSEAQFHNVLQAALEDARYVKTKKGQPVLDQFGRPVTPLWNPSITRVREVGRALQAHTDVSVQLGAEVVDNVWLKPADGAPRPACYGQRVVSFRNGLVPVAGDRTVYPHTPLWFSQTCVPYDFDPKAAEPREWLAFLASVWGDSPDSIATLQEFFGYVLSGRTDLHAYLQLNGPSRSGKGVIMHVLGALVGDGNHEGIALADLAKNFGLERLVGKSLATVGDARLSRNGHAELLERLLTITAADRVQVDRKYRKAWSGVLGARLVIATNEPLTLADESGALAARTVLLRTTKSFAGKEDRGLVARIVAELPGVVNWALAGLDRLNVQGGRFTKPEQSSRMEATLRRAAAPLSAFLDDWCTVDPKATTPKVDLYECYAQWAKQNGQEHVMTAPQFATKLYATGSGIEETRPRIDGKRVQCFQGVSIRAVLVPGSGYTDPADDDEQPEQTPAAPVLNLPEQAAPVEQPPAGGDPFAVAGLDYEF